MTEQRDRGVSRRVEQEIEEILARAGDLGEGPARPKPGKSFARPPQDTRKWAPGTPRAASFWSRLGGTSQLMLLAVVFTIAAYVASVRFPLLGVLCTLAAVGCFIAAYVIAFRRPRPFGSERRWRGQPIEYRDSAGSDLGATVRHWWNRLTNRT